MKIKWIVLLCLPLFMAPSVQAGSGVDMKEGKWEITVTTEVTGMPMKMPATTYTQCIKKDEPVPHQEQPNQQCQMSDVKTKGNTVSWTMTCNSPGGDMVGKGKITYAGDKMNGGMEVETQGMKMITQLDGRRVGPCK